MAFTRALYYPHIDIPDEGWLKTAALYWENIQTIVPASIRRPYSSRTARELEEAQVLSAFNVDPDMEIMERLAEKAGAYLESPEFERIMRENGINEYALIHQKNCPRDSRIRRDPPRQAASRNSTPIRRTHGRKKKWLDDGSSSSRQFLHDSSRY